VKATTCGEAVMKLLSAYEVDTVFGMAGTDDRRAVIAASHSKGSATCQCRNEQGASLVADGYARATGKPGVCTIIAGPGVTNASTGIAQAYCDSQTDARAIRSVRHTEPRERLGAIHELPTRRSSGTRRGRLEEARAPSLPIARSGATASSFTSSTPQATSRPGTERAVASFGNLKLRRSGALRAADHAAVRADDVAGGLRACLRCKLRASPVFEMRDRQEQRSRLKQCAEVERRADAPVTFGQVRHRRQ